MTDPTIGVVLQYCGPNADVLSGVLETVTAVIEQAVQGPPLDMGPTAQALGVSAPVKTFDTGLPDATGVTLGIWGPTAGDVGQRRELLEKQRTAFLQSVSVVRNFQNVALFVSQATLQSVADQIVATLSNGVTSVSLPLGFTASLGGVTIACASPNVVTTSLDVDLKSSVVQATLTVTVTETLTIDQGAVVVRTKLASKVSVTIPGLDVAALVAAIAAPFLGPFESTLAVALAAAALAQAGGATRFTAAAITSAVQGMLAANESPVSQLAFMQGFAARQVVAVDAASQGVFGPAAIVAALFPCNQTYPLGQGLTVAFLEADCGIDALVPPGLRLAGSTEAGFFARTATVTIHFIPSTIQAWSGFPNSLEGNFYSFDPSNAAQNGLRPPVDVTWTSPGATLSQPNYPTTAISFPVPKGKTMGSFACSVSLTVTDADGLTASDTASVPVQIVPEPKPPLRPPK